jgi:carboxylesterase
MTDFDFEPFLLQGTRSIGLLLVHGFLSYAGEMLELAEILHRNGYTVLGVQLPGHHPPDYPDLHQYSHHDWLASAEEALDTLLQQTPRVVACGASMGGSVALYLASRRSLYGVVTICTPHHLGPNFLRFQSVLPLLYGPISRVSLKVTRPVRPPPYIPERLRWLADIRKIRVPLSAYVDAALLILKADQKLRNVTCPALIFHDAELLYHTLASRDKELLWLNNSGHAALLDNDRELIYSRVIAFMARLAQFQSVSLRSSE